MLGRSPGLKSNGTGSEGRLRLNEECGPKTSEGARVEQAAQLATAAGCQHTVK